MWKRGGRSSALDRAQALLSAKRNRGDVESVQGSTGNTGAVGGSLKNKSASLSTHPLLSDLSDLSSVSSAPEHGGNTMLGSAAASGKTQAREGLSTMDLRPQSSPGGGGSRFLKKAPPPAAISSLSPPVSKSHMQHVPEHRNVSSSQRGSQTAALSRLAQIESRIRSRKPVQVQEQEKARWGPKPAENLNSDVDVSPPPAARSLEAPVQLSAQSSSDQTRFLKNKTAVAASDNITTAAARSPKGADVGVRSRAADAVVPLAGLETKQVRVVSGVSLESDEEDMRKLLGDSLDSVDNSVSIPGRRSSAAHSSPPPPAAVPPSSSSNTAPPRSPASPPRRSSPFRFAGQAQAHFSPSVLFSPSPSPPCCSPRGAGSPRRSLSSASGRGEEVLSLEELFSEEPLSEMSAVTSEDFRINVMTLDDLGFTERTAGEEREVQHSVPPPESPNRHQERPRLKKKEKKDEQQQQQQEEEEEDALDYESDFESESRTEPDHSQVSEHLQGDGDEEEEAVSEVREEASHSDVSRGRMGDDYTGTLSDTSGSWTSGHSQKLSDSRSSRSSSSRGSRTLSRQSRRRASARKVLKETAVQTQPDPLAYTWPAGVAALGPAVAETYMDPTPAVAYTLSAEMVEALSISNPAAFALNEMLKQQLAVTRGFIESRRRLHSSLVQSLGPPSYRYTTLEDTKEYIRERRPPKLKMEEALEEVLQEMRDYHHI